jgi:hypothetical protein
MTFYARVQEQADGETLIEEGQASLAAYESSLVPLDHPVQYERTMVPFTPSKGPPPNWMEQVSLAKRQDRLLRDTTRMIQLALATLENDIYATRVASASQYLEDALTELDEYKMEGGEQAVDSLLGRLQKSVQLTCRHEGKIKHNEGYAPDNGEWFETFHCENCGNSWTEWPEQSEESEDLP